MNLGRWLFAVLAVFAGLSLRRCEAIDARDSKSAEVWTARWIAAPAGDDSTPLPMFRREFLLRGKVASATLRISGLGQYEAHIDGVAVGRGVLNPAWSDPRKRVFFNSYDVTRLLRRGPNAIGVMLGNGMYNVPATPGRYSKFTGSFGQPQLIAQLDVRFAGGGGATVTSDNTWQTAAGPITFSSVYGGEDYDARLEQPGWDKPGFHRPGWVPVQVVSGPGGALAPQTIPPIAAFERYEPVKVTHPHAGVAVYDLGENFAGWPEIEVSGERGASVTLIAGELLDAQGLVTQKSANAFPDSRNSFTYTLKGGPVEAWHPRFSDYGFRYVQVETAGEEPPVVRDLDGRFLHDAVAVDGHFSSSDELLNRIHILITRAMLSNMKSVLTDCPHREKLGWLEQTHLAAASLMYNYGLAAMYGKIADDMQDAQLPDGMVPDIAPEFTVFSGAFRDSPEWGSAVVLSTWSAYQFYGDAGLLRDHYASMTRYVDYLSGRAQGHLLTYGLGDWYDIGPQPPGESQLTSKGLTATAIYYQDLTVLARIAGILGREGDAVRFRAEAQAVASAFNQRFFHAGSHSYDTGSQTANAMPLVVGLVPEGSREAVLARLVADIHSHANHVTAGDIGFHYVVRALTDSGRSDVLYDMLSRTDPPSYGNQLAHGATTLTEAWDANPNSSQNHFMLGHAEEWFYRGLAGIDFDRTREAAERIRISPAVVGDVRSVEAGFASSLGPVRSAWHRQGEDLHMEIVLPVPATVVLPEGYGTVLVNGERPAAGGKILALRDEGGRTSLVVAAGRWRIDARR
jgi:hypothetical protein